MIDANHVTIQTPHEHADGQAYHSEQAGMETAEATSHVLTNPEGTISEARTVPDAIVNYDVQPSNTSGKSILTINSILQQKRNQEMTYEVAFPGLENIQWPIHIEVDSPHTWEEISWYDFGHAIVKQVAGQRSTRLVVEFEQWNVSYIVDTEKADQAAAHVDEQEAMSWDQEQLDMVA